MKFNVRIHCKTNVKLVIHEILWKKNFTVYPSLYHTEKITVLKIIYYLLLFHFIKFFFFHKFFLECFLVEFPYFLSFMMLKIFFVFKSNTEQPLLAYILFLILLMIHWTNINTESNDYCTVYLKDNMWIVME